MKIELIPLIELPTFKYSDLEEISDLNLKSRLLIERNYTGVKDLIPLNNMQYKVTDISDSDLKKAIELHISDLPIKDSCSLFGGYALQINDEIVLYPQCCGLLSEIDDWKKLLKNDFKPFYLSECHPSPKFKKVKDEVIIECDSNDESFYPKTKNIIKLDYESLKIAVKNVIKELEEISKRLDKFSAEFNAKNISRILIWEE